MSRRFPDLPRGSEPGTVLDRLLSSWGIRACGAVFGLVLMLMVGFEYGHSPQFKTILTRSAPSVFCYGRSQIFLSLRIIMPQRLPPCIFLDWDGPEDAWIVSGIESGAGRGDRIGTWIEPSARCLLLLLLCRTPNKEFYMSLPILTELPPHVRTPPLSFF